MGTEWHTGMVDEWYKYRMAYRSGTEWHTWVVHKSGTSTSRQTVQNGTHEWYTCQVLYYTSGETRVLMCWCIERQVPTVQLSVGKTICQVQFVNLEDIKYPRVPLVIQGPGVKLINISEHPLFTYSWIQYHIFLFVFELTLRAIYFVAASANMAISPLDWASHPTKMEVTINPLLLELFMAISISSDYCWS